METTCAPNEMLIKVRFVEIDSMMLAHNSKYYVWFEEGRFDFAKRVLNFQPGELNTSILLPVVKSQCRYFHPVRLGDTLRLTTHMHVQGQSAKISFYYAIHKPGTHICHAIGKTEHAMVDVKGKIMLKVPDSVRKIFEAVSTDHAAYFLTEEQRRDREDRLAR